MSNILEEFDKLCERLGDNKGIVLPTEEMLRAWSFRTSLSKSTNKLQITDDIINLVESDSHAYETVLQSEKDLLQFMYRVKTPDSIRRKVERHPDLRFQSVFNDILGIRIKVPSLNIEIPDYYRVVDMRGGKALDDGYRAIHLYYKMDNFHYQIEIQLWEDADFEFNMWMHICDYKSFKPEILRELRNRYDTGVITSMEDYRREVCKLCQK